MLIPQTSTVGLPAPFFDTLGLLKCYTEIEIKATLQDIRTCFEAITFNDDLLKCLKKAVSLCSKFLVIFFSLATIRAGAAVAVPRSMAVTRTADHLQNDDDEGRCCICCLYILIYFFALLYNYTS